MNESLIEALTETVDEAIINALATIPTRSKPLDSELEVIKDTMLDNIMKSLDKKKMQDEVIDRIKQMSRAHKTVCRLSRAEMRYLEVTMPR